MCNDAAGKIAEVVFLFTGAIPGTAFNEAGVPEEAVDPRVGLRVTKDFDRAVLNRYGPREGLVPRGAIDSDDDSLRRPGTCEIDRAREGLFDSLRCGRKQNKPTEKACVHGRLTSIRPQVDERGNGHRYSNFG